MAGPGRLNYNHRRSYPALPKGYNWDTQKQRYCPHSFLTREPEEGETDNAEHQFGYVFCHRGLYERASRIVDNSISAVQNGKTQGFYLHEVDAFVLTHLEEAFFAHDENPNRVTSKEKDWGNYSFHSIVESFLVTRRFQTEAPDFASSYLTTKERVPALFNFLWQTMLNPSEITVQVDLREKDFATALSYHSFHVSKWDLCETPLDHYFETPIWNLFQSTILKGYNLHFKSFQDVRCALDEIYWGDYGNVFETDQLHLFPPLIMVFSSDQWIDLVKEQKAKDPDRTSRDYYLFIYAIIMKQVSSFTNIGPKGYNFILEIAHSGLGLGYNIETGVARNPLNGAILRDADVKIESLVDRAMIEVSLELRKRYPKLRFSSCTRLPDAIIDGRNYKFSFRTSKPVPWKDGEKGLSTSLRAIHGGLYPQSHFVVADDPSAEISARTWIDEKAGRPRWKLLLEHNRETEWLPYNQWLDDGQVAISYNIPSLKAHFRLNQVEVEPSGMASISTLDSIDPTPGDQDDSTDLVKRAKMWLDKEETVSNPSLEPDDVVVRSGDSKPVVSPARDSDERPENHSTRVRGPIVLRIMNLLFRFRDISPEGAIILVDKSCGKLKIIARDQNEWSAVATHVAIVAAARGHEKKLRNLIINGLEINTPNGISNIFGSILEAACASGRKAIVDLLLEENTNLQPHWPARQLSPLESACRYGHCEIVEALLQHYKKTTGNVNIPPEFFRKALHHACLAEQVTTVRLLLRHGVDVNNTTGRYGTALGVACAVGHQILVELLLEHNADWSIRWGGKSPLFWACRHKHIKIAKILLARGAKIDFEYDNEMVHETLSFLLAADPRLYRTHPRPPQPEANTENFFRKSARYLWRSPIRAQLCSGNKSCSDCWMSNLQIKRKESPEIENCIGRSTRFMWSPCGIEYCGVCSLDGNITEREGSTKVSKNKPRYFLKNPRHDLIYSREPED